MNWEARAKELQRQVDNLEFELESLRSALSVHGAPPFAGLTSSEQKIAQLLRDRSPNVVTKDAILDLMYAFRSDGEIPDAKIVDVYVCKMRPKLEQYGIAIETVWARGYSMPTTSAAAWDLAVGKLAA